MQLYKTSDTEPIFSTLDRYRAELAEHPLLVAARSGQIERETLIRFAYYQYADSITWIPMLAQMKSKALRSRRLRRAMVPHYADLAGVETTYFTEHVHVDSDEHAQWMAEAVHEVIALYGAECVPAVLEGMADAWAETLEDPTALWGMR